RKEESRQVFFYNVFIYFFNHSLDTARISNEQNWRFDAFPILNPNSFKVSAAPAPPYLFSRKGTFLPKYVAWPGLPTRDKS
ncbi:MAG: hypothetical protein ACI8VT_003568, partial [Saprospiraceae bacterium]